jgi:LysR family transcriptional activator of nhaA
VSWLNYHHLQCFWLVGRRGGLEAAGKVLHVSPSTVWAQVRALEASLDLKLLEKRGRRLALTAQGERIAGIADELFALGQEVLAVARGEDLSLAPLRVGVTTGLPRLVTQRLVQPAIAAGCRLQLHHGAVAPLLDELTAGRVDVVLSDEPRAHPRSRVQVLGTSRLAWFGARALTRRLGARYPRSLDDAPLLLPLPGSAQRHALDAELGRLGVRPRVVAEVDDSALLKTMARTGLGLVAAPELLAAELGASYGLRALGRLATSESWFAIALELKARHPGLEALLAR